MHLPTENEFSNLRENMNDELNLGLAYHEFENEGYNFIKKGNTLRAVESLSKSLELRVQSAYDSGSLDWGHSVAILRLCVMLKYLLPLSVFSLHTIRLAEECVMDPYIHPCSPDMYEALLQHAKKTINQDEDLFDHIGAKLIKKTPTVAKKYKLF
jgi:hypothetical protein